MPIRELSRRTGISPDLLRKWERRYGLTAPERTPGGHRLYSRVDEARVRLMLNGVNRGMRPAQAAQHALGARLAIASRPPAPGAAERAALRRQAIVQALSRYDEGRADAALEPLEAELSPAELVREVLWPLLTDPGVASNEAVGPVALGWAERRLARLTPGWDRGAGPHAVLAGDQRGTTTAWMLSFGLALHSFGWRITQLGGALPLAALERAVRVARPAAIVLAVVDPAAVTRVVAELDLSGRVAVAMPDRRTAARRPSGPSASESSQPALPAVPRAERIVDPDPLAAAAAMAV